MIGTKAGIRFYTSSKFRESHTHNSIINTKSFQIVQKGGFKFTGEFAQGGFVFADTFDDFVLHVSDVHDVLDGVAGKFERAADEIGKDKGAPVADVRVVIYGGAAAVEADVFTGGVKRGELLHGARQCIEEFQGHLRTGKLNGGRRKQKQFIDLPVGHREAG